MQNQDPNQETFLRLFLRNEDGLRGHSRALLPNWDAVSEVMQEASVVMWRKLDQLRNKSEFLPWAKVVVRYEALKARQTVARDRLCFSEDVLELLGAEERDEGERLAREREALTGCLRKLDPAQKELVLLPYHGHGAVTELANQSGRTGNSLYKKIGRLRQKLTLCVQRQLAIGEG
ncbi:MAG: RNA polymerase sigma-70 factor (ECF subfamily) [Rhodothermales bacterium]|jgi:RNA polymerase sigma-70 factor (ECF subfamily)